MDGIEPARLDARNAREAVGFRAGERIGDGVLNARRIVARTVTLCQYISMG
jgi:hypothetical protein